MATSSTAKTGSETGLGINDLGPLAWVLDELRKSLDSATKALKRYVRDAELAKGSDLSSADASQLRIARQQMHQSVGALEMVGFAAPATVLRGMEAAVQKFVAKPELCDDAAAAKVERASFALLGYLEALLNGKSPMAVELFSQYAEVQELAGASRIHPADLWITPWAWRSLVNSDAPVMELDASFRAQFDKSALQVVKTADIHACGELAKLSAGLANQTQLAVDTHFSIFWRIAAGALEAVATGALKPDLYVKRTVSRLLIQLATHVKGDLSVPDRLAQDLLFFCAQATPQGMSPMLGEVRMVYGLASYAPIDYTKSFYGQFDPSVLVQARKRIGQLKESWSSFTAGEISKAKPVQDQMSLLVDSIHKLLPTTGQDLASALNEVIDSTAKQSRAPDATLGMEVATAILYVEASFEDFDPEDAQQSSRMSHLAQRVQMARGGAASQPLESWMEELYRRVSDRQTMGSVVGELKLTLGELEKMMDAYFRDPQDKLLLSDVPGRLTQMRGVLAVLGLDHASQAVMKMRDSVEHLMVTDTDVEQVRAAGTFDKLGNNLGALGFLIDMLSYQPVLAKKMFLYDEAEGELKPLMGRTIEEPAVAASLTQASGFGGLGLPGTPTPAINEVVSTASVVAPSPVAAAPVAPVIVDADEVDPELLEIFLEEAREVAANGLAATQALRVEPNNIGEMTTLRRAFHTLKGSSRMVGLNVFGEAAWSMEQMLNNWLADQKPANSDMCDLCAQALQGHQVWIEEIAVGGGKQRTAAPFRASADALRLHGKFVPIALDAVVAETVVAEPVVDTFDVALPPVELEAPVQAISSAAQAAPLAAGAALAASAAAMAFDLPSLDLSAVDAVQAVPPISPAEPEPVMDMAEFDLPTLPQLDPMPAVEEASQLAESDFSVDLSEFDLPAASAAMPLAMNEPVVTIASPVALPVVEPESAIEPVLAKAPEIPPSVEALAQDVDFDFDLDLPTEEAASPLSEASVLTADSMDASSVTLSSKAAELEPQTALIDEDELAAFERAMMEMDGQNPSSESMPLPEIATSASQASELEGSADQSAINDIDMQALKELSANSWKPAPKEFKAMQLAGTELVDMDQLMSSVQASAPAATLSQQAASGAALTGAALVAGAGVSAFVGNTAASRASVPETNFGNFAAEEQFKAVGPLRVSLPLYNVYLNEADEWSRRLANVLAEWAMEPHAATPNDAVAFAHSLAGSSATVGFTGLSGLSRHLENALTHMQRIEEDGAYDSHVHASLFVETAEAIRHLLHQFAAGILKDSPAELEAQLARCMEAPFAPEAAQESTTITTRGDSGFIDLDGNKPLAPVESSNFAIDSIANTEYLDAAPEVSALEQVVQTESTVLDSEPAATADVITLAATPEPQPQPPTSLANEKPTDLSGALAATALGLGAVSSVAAVVTSTPVQSVAALASLTEAPVLAVRSRQVGQDEIDDEIDAVDAIDPDLFEIFEEEALELFPTTASALRQWSARPSNMSARSEVLRGLHTFKGSARLAGAMRLGELAHRMESSVESIPHEGAQSADIEALMAQLDGMQHNFDVLRNPALANETPVQAKAAPASSPADNVSTAASVAAALTAGASTVAAATPLKPVASAAGGTIAPAAAMRSAPGQTVRVRAQLLDRLMNQAGEVMITRARLEAELSQLRGSLSDLSGNLDKLRLQLRELDVQAESQMQTRLQQTKETEASFDPLEFDRYTRVQELTRMMAESVNDVATVHRNIQRTIESTEDDLIMQARQTRDLQRDLLRTRMVEFEGISERLYRVVRQAGKDAGKQVKLDILGGTIEMDRGVLDRMTPAFEHLLRNCVAHGIETADARTAAGKSASGEIIITLHQEGNDVSIEFRDDGAGLNIARIREKAVSQGLIGNDATLADGDAANLIFTPGFSTAAQVTELSGRGVGMDVVRSEVVALGGRIETATSAGQGTSFKLVLPLTTAVTQVVMMRIGQLAIGIPANLIEIVRRATQKELQSAYNSGTYEFGGESLPFYWAGALLQHSAASTEPATKTLPVAVFRSAAQRVALHIDEVLGNQEVVVKNLGPQLSRLPGLAGMTVMASGAVALIYNPVALATVYGQQARAMSFDPAQPHALESQSQFQDISDAKPRDLSGDAQPVVPLVPANPASISPPTVPLVLVVDDSITVRRVTQRLLQREGYRVSMAADGLQALERLAEEIPTVILSDIEMPRMDGFDLLRNVRGDAKLKHLPTIMITSRIAEKHREHAMELGANHYLGKPYSEEELLSLIRRYAREEAGLDMPV
jgi:chemosensory pili system protein ChpA (sensor histidine kinase/response regulator)